ncbi:diguanylate cyclase [Bacillus sp. M6-12]|uniref:sensor domain-containing diguanylate cyclase n=1 Tax=Bacillus sp. M6-12 TaxID=2054166 RepID=UPI000C75A755|nr:diguanylate cyclase [Bacillus sp. M6-12]PLS15501.1 diguanylate cyclase [Bacillus sp. M6-12]
MSIKLRTFFAIFFAFGIIVLTAFLSTIIGNKTLQQVELESGQALSGITWQMADKLDYFMWSRYGEIEVLSELEALRSMQNKEEVRKILDQLSESIPSFSWAGVIDREGKVFASTGGLLEEADISERPVFQKAKSDTYIGDVHDAVLLSKLLPNPSGAPLQFVDISTPIYGKTGEAKGVLAAHFSWEWSKEMSEKVLHSYDDHIKNMDILVVSSRNNTVLLGPKELVGKPLNIKSVKEAQKQKSGWLLEKWPDGKKYVTGYAYGKGYLNYPGLGWSVLARQHETEAFSSAKELQSYIFYIGTISAVICAALGWIIAGVISSPLSNISQAAKRLQQGEKTEIPSFRGIKDIEILTSSLKQLIATLINTESKLGKMEDLAYLDGLTGLANRMSLYLFLNNKIKNMDPKEKLIFLFMDLDGFKGVNDQWGHRIGDLLLVETGRRLGAIQNRNAFISRLGGDEFIIILSVHSDSPDREARKTGELIIDDINMPYEIEGISLQIGCSIGAAIRDSHGEDVDTMLRLADEALYVSKRDGKNRITIYENSKNAG